VGDFRGGLVFKAHRLVYHSTLGSRVIKKKREEKDARHDGMVQAGWSESCQALVRSHEERRCSILGPTQSRISPSIL